MTVRVDDRLWLIVVVADGERYEVGPREQDAAEDFVAKINAEHPTWTAIAHREGDNG